jgi:hypothetical protein
MLETFDAVLKRLDKMGREAHNSRWLKLVKNRFEGLEEAYKILNQDGRVPIDYRELPTQAAYLYAYGMPRAYFCDEFLRRHREALRRPLFSKEELNVVSFGGGPASELIGLINYLSDREMGEPVSSICYRIYDKDGDWERVAERIAKKAETEISINLAYHSLDLAEAAETQKIDISDADLVIFSYIISELCALDTKDQIEININTILGKLKSGSNILFIESRHPDFINFFKACKGYNGRRLNDDEKPVIVDCPPFPRTFQSYRINLNRQPRMSSDKILSQWYVKS